MSGRIVLDVGCGSAEFVRKAVDNYGAKECWGLDHHPQAIKEAVSTGNVKPEEKDRLLLMPFSGVLQRPDLKGYFDVVKITAVTNYADAKELRHMLKAAHYAVKPDGCVLLELPWMYHVGTVFGANQSVQDSAQTIMNAQLKMLEAAQSGNRKVMDRVMGSAERLSDAYSQLAELYFGSVEKHTLAVSTNELLLKSPREKTPDVKDIIFDVREAKLKLGPSATAIKQKIKAEKPAEREEEKVDAVAPNPFSLATKPNFLGGILQTQAGSGLLDGLFAKGTGTSPKR